MTKTIDVAETGTCYVPVSTSMLSASTIIGVPLYLKDNETRKYPLYRAAHYPFCDEDLAKLRESGVTKLYVHTQDQNVLQQYLRASLEQNLQDETLSVEGRFAHLNEVVRDVLGEVFDDGSVSEIVDTTHSMARCTVDLICRSDAVASRLCAVLYHDYHTFTHSANVAFYCVMLAKALGITNRKDLNAIAVGALLHDLGKLEIPDSILTKPGKLTDEEFALIKEHPTKGFLALRRRDDLSLGQLMMVYQHHERLDGSGYPVGIEGDGIHHWALICAVCDVFEALTSHRPYRSGMSFEEAFRIMDRGEGSGFDREIYRCWKTTIQSS